MKTSRYLSLLVLASSLSSGTLLAADDACRSLLQKVQRYLVNSTTEFNQALVRDFFRDQKEGPYLARGLLVELSDGRKDFVISEYLGSEHKIMLQDVELSNSPASVKNILWVGEVEFEMGATQVVVSRANHTSGMWFNATRSEDSRPLPLQTPAENIKNDGNELIAFFEKHKVPLKKEFVVESFQQEKPHLFPVVVSKGKSLLHEYQNQASYLGLALYALSRGDNRASEADIREMAIESRDDLELRWMPIADHVLKMHHPDGESAFSRDALLNFEIMKQLEIVASAPEGDSTPAYKSAIEKLEDPNFRKQGADAVGRISILLGSVTAASKRAKIDPPVLPKVIHFLLSP